MNQTFDDYEVIIVDDGSTDNSSCICDSFAVIYPEKIHIIHKENQGLISARRIAIDKAQGEFCIFVDSDDFVECNLLEIVNSYLLKDDNIDMVIYSFNYYCGGIKTDRNRFVADDSEIWSADNKKKLYELLATGDSIDALWIKAVKTEILKRDPIDYKKYFSNNTEIHAIVNFTHNTTAKLTVMGNILDVSIYEYVDNEEHDANLLFSGMLLKQYFVYMDTGEIEEI